MRCQVRPGSSGPTCSPRRQPPPPPSLRCRYTPASQPPHAPLHPIPRTPRLQLDAQRASCARACSTGCHRQQRSQPQRHRPPAPRRVAARCCARRSSAGADTQAVDADGWTATRAALSHLLAAGAPVDAPAGSSQQTPRHWAAATGEAVLVAALLAAGSDACVADAGGRTALQLAEARLASLEAQEARAPYQMPSGKLDSSLAAARLLRTVEARQRRAAAAPAASAAAGAAGAGQGREVDVRREGWQLRWSPSPASDSSACHLYPPHSPLPRPATGAAAKPTCAGSVEPATPCTPPHACSLASAAASDDGASACSSSGGSGGGSSGGGGGLRKCRVCLQEKPDLLAHPLRAQGHLRRLHRSPASLPGGRGTAGRRN